MKTGTIVRLKSGGPLMTVHGIDPSLIGKLANSTPRAFECVWFNKNGDACSRSFFEAALIEDSLS